MRWSITLTILMGLATGCTGQAPVVKDGSCPDAPPLASTSEPPPAEAAAPKAAPTRLILVRNAEKVDDSQDAALSERGQARAAELARVLADAEVDAIYSTDFQRTRDTVAPLAEARHLEVRLYDPARAAAIAPEIVARHAGQTVLVVGHSPSVPAMVDALLGEERLAKLQRYDQLFVVVADGEGAELVVLRYGARDETRRRR